MKYSSWDIGGNIVKKDDRYIVKDNTQLKNLVVSCTDLQPYKSTTGHKHQGQEEVYIFVKGAGTIFLDDVPHYVQEGDTVLIEDGVHHRVTTGPEGLYFICVFVGRRHNA